MPRSGFALKSGLFPICQKGIKQLLGVGCGLLHSVLETPNAPTHPHPFRVGVSGISTAKGQDPVTAPLICKAEIIQRWSSTHSYCFWVFGLSPPPPFSLPRWLHGLIDTYGGVQPDIDEVHIPAGRKGDVKGWYDEELENGNTDLIKVSARQFNRVWLETLPHLKCRAFLRFVIVKAPTEHVPFSNTLSLLCCFLLFFLGRFAVCDQCILIEDNIRKAGNNAHERATWQKAKTIHREYVSSTACAIYFPVLCNIKIQSGCTFVCVLVGTLRKRYVHVSLQPLCT